MRDPEIREYVHRRIVGLKGEMSTSELARRAGISRTTLRDQLRSRKYSEYSLYRLAAVFDVPLSDFFPAVSDGEDRADAAKRKLARIRSLLDDE